MSETAPMAAPDLMLGFPLSKFKREQAAFERLKPQLLSEYRAQYVAIHEEQVVGHGSELVAVALEAHRHFGHVAIYVDLVTDEAPCPVRIPHVRVVSRGLPVIRCEVPS